MSHHKVKYLIVLSLLICSGAQATNIGKGSYADTLPPSFAASKKPPTAQYITGNISAPVPTTKWYSSLITTQYSNNHYAYPLSMSVSNGASYTGLNLGLPAVTASADAVNAGMLTDLEVRGNIGGRDLKADAVRVDAYSDWTVTPKWQDSTDTSKYFQATYGHGLVYVYFEFSGGCDPKIVFSGNLQQVFDENGNIANGSIATDHIGLKFNNVYYGLFAPSGSTFNISNTQITVTMPGVKRFFSLAPITAQAGLGYYYQHAYAFVTGTQVSWDYNESTNDVTSTFAATVAVKQGTTDTTLMALLPHQYKNSSAIVSNTYTYTTLLGKMKLLEGNSFTVTNKFHGLIPYLPDRGNYSKTHLATLLGTDKDSSLAKRDTYFNGKQVAKIANLIPIAEQMQDTATRDYLVSRLKTVLVDWLTASPEETSRFFYYDPLWGGLIGYDAQFYGYNYTDHHFHYGYLVYAAALLSLYDSSFINDYGPMVEYLIRDYANWRRDDTQFPFLRHFDPYMGHSYCDGLGNSDDGNNQESSSEAMNAWSAVILWGMVSGNKTIRDLGIWGYTTEYSGVHDYYFDVDDDVYPAAYKHKTTGILFDSKIIYGTWFSGQDEAIYGIQMIPSTAGMLYLGYYPDYCKANYDAFFADNGGYESYANWYDILWKFQCFYDPDLALQKYSEYLQIDSDGDSFTFLYHWIYNLQALGKVDISTSANTPYYAVFDKSGVRTYVAYNPTGSTQKVTFSGAAGGNLYVKAHTLAAAKVFASEVSKITASTYHNAGKSYLTIDGSGFQSGVSVILQKTGQPQIAATKVTLVNSTQITAELDLTGLSPGEWTLLVVNTGGDTSSAQPNSFVVSGNAPSITRVTPDRSANRNKTILAVFGANFYAGLDARLTRSGEQDIIAETLALGSATQLAAEFDTREKSAGFWNLILTNTDGQASSLANALEITSGGAVYAYPNPCKAAASAEVMFVNVREGSSLDIYNLAGELVFSAGDITVSPYHWKLTNNSGEKIASGVYIYLLKTGGDKQTGTLAVIK